MKGACAHPGRAGRSAKVSLHARPGRHALQRATQEKYQKLIASGKAAKIAITAITRKLIVLANALLRDKRNWTPNTSC